MKAFFMLFLLLKISEVEGIHTNENNNPQYNKANAFLHSDGDWVYLNSIKKSHLSNKGPLWSLVLAFPILHKVLCYLLPSFSKYIHE